MKNPKHPRHEEATSKGGLSHSQKVYWCELCQQPGQGPKFKNHHINTGRCEGKGVKNYYSKKRLAQIMNLF